MTGQRSSRRQAEADLRLELARCVIDHGPTWTKRTVAEAETLLGATPTTAAQYRQAIEHIRRRREQAS